MQRKIFIEGIDPNTRAYIGWQDRILSLYGLKQGYKKSADDLVDIALEYGKKNRSDILDTYIFPILHSYRHSIEISLKLIYVRTFGEIPKGGHDLLKIWDEFIIGKVIKAMGISIEKKEEVQIRNLIKELQVKNSNASDSKAEVWRYLMDKHEELYFNNWEYIDYLNLKQGIGFLFDYLDALDENVHYILNQVSE